MVKAYAAVSDALAKNWPESPICKSPENLPEIIWRFTEDVPISEVRAAIIGQDPGVPEHSCGLAFSYPLVATGEWCATKMLLDGLELSKEISFRMPETYDLSKWSKRGVLLLNVALTKAYQYDEDGSRVGGQRPFFEDNLHGDAWAVVTGAILQHIAANNADGVAFFLLGWAAKTKMWIPVMEALEREDKRHLVKKAPHPCSADAYPELFKLVFEDARRFWLEQGLTPVDWRLRKLKKKKKSEKTSRS